jgi:hypothetical protein
VVLIIRSALQYENNTDAFQQAVRTAQSTGISNAGNTADIETNEAAATAATDPTRTRHPTRIVFTPDMGGLCTDMVDEEVASICLHACQWFASDASNYCKVVSGPLAQAAVRRMLMDPCCHDKAGENENETTDVGDDVDTCPSRIRDMELMYSAAQLARIEADHVKRAKGTYADCRFQPTCLISRVNCRSFPIENLLLLEHFIEWF